MANEPTDEELMLRYGDGDAGAFEALYRRHRGPMYRFLLRQAGNAATAEELFQDVWMRIVNARTGYAASAKFTTWAYTIAHNRLMDFFRATGRVNLVSDEDAPVDQIASNEAPIEERIDSRRAAARLLEALARLPAVQREAFLLQQEGELSLEEIAAVTGANRETVKSRLRYAMAKLRSSLGRK